MAGVEPLPPGPAGATAPSRRVGVELEFGGLDLAEAALVVRRQFGGRLDWTGPHHVAVRDTEFGDFQVALDTRLAQAGPAAPGDGLLEEIQREAADMLGEVMKFWTPREIATPPLPLRVLGRIDTLAMALREAGAEGSAAAPYYAYALQLNPEAPRLDWPHVLRMLQSFLLLEDWLRRRSLRDLSRRLGGFVRHFPDGYRRHVLQPGYRPGWDGLVRDYLAENRTRNRDLDMLPLFAHCRPALVADRFRDGRVKARPAYHYRLPDSRLDEPGWSVSGEWRNWARVEALAADEAGFQRARRAWLDWGARAEREAWSAWIGEMLPQEAPACPGR